MGIRGKSVAVIGAGIGGLAVARALALRGADVTVLEQAGEISEVGAGLQISPNGFAVLRALGLGDALARQAVRGQAVQLKDYRGADVVRLDLGRLPENQPYYFVHRADLIDLLSTAAQDAGVEIRLFQQVGKVTQGDKPEVQFTNGNSLTAELVVGADGLHSRLRPLLNGEARPFFTGQVAWRAVVPNRFGREGEVQVHMGPKRHLVSYPLRGGKLMNLVAVQERTAWADEGWHHSDSRANLQHAFANFCPEVRELLADIDVPNLWGLFRHPVAARWTGRNVAILGDAAHPTLPFMAQGANMALEDAWVLAEQLDSETDTSRALQSYVSLRKPRATRVIAAANGNAWKYHLKSGPIRAAAHMALRLGGRVSPDRMLHQFDWIYAHDVTKGVGLDV